MGSLKRRSNMVDNTPITPALSITLDTFPLAIIMHNTFLTAMKSTETMSFKTFLWLQVFSESDCAFL